MSKHLHFTIDEFKARRASALKAMADAGLDALLMFRQESMYYLTGYDTFGYVFFQCLVLTSDGRTLLLTRAPDLRQARFTSIVDDIAVWRDGSDAKPAEHLAKLLNDLGLAGKTLGVEYEAYGLTAANGRALEAALANAFALRDASRLVTTLRLIKSDAELVYVREAARLADLALEAGLAETRAGAFEGDILAAMHGAIYRNGGDDPANEFIIGSGPGAMMCRYFTGRRVLDAQDQLTLEFAGAFRHYHACLMRTIVVGEARPRQRELSKAAEDALLGCEAALKPSCTVGDVFASHAATLDRAGLGRYRLNACGYSLGATFAPNWMDWPMIYEGSPVELTPGMVFFLHMIVFDDDEGVAATLGRTSIVTASGAEVLSKAHLGLLTS